MASTNNDHNALIRTSDGEPLCKRTKYADDDVCVDLKSLISYDEEIINKPTKSIDSLSTQNEDAGDSGFQDSQESISNGSTSNKDAACDSTEDQSNRKSQQQITFSNNNQFLQSNNLNQQNEDEHDDLNNIQLQNLNDEEDSESIISDISCLSDLSDLENAEKWQNPGNAPLWWVRQQMMSGTNPRQIIDGLLPNNVIPSNQVGDLTLWKFIMNILSEQPRRKKLDHVNTLEDVVSLIKQSKKIMVLTGAGISVSSGIPDFRSRNGIYARLNVDFPDLPNPQAMFDIHYFRKDQRPFYKFAKSLLGQFSPSISHKFIKLIETNGKLLRNYTQNIDALEKAANIERVITCHGSFATASCTNCKYQVDGSVLKEDIFAQRIPLCPKCPPDTDALCVLKPDIVFFGESLPEEFHNMMERDKDKCDLLIVIGSSLKVRPVALIPTSLPADVPQILINRENLADMTFDVELLGDCDVIIQELCHRLGEGWDNICVNEKLKEAEDFFSDDFCNNSENANYTAQPDNSNVSQSDDSPSDAYSKKFPDNSYVYVPPSRYLFKGAELYSYDDSDEYSNDDEDSNDDENSNDCQDLKSQNKNSTDNSSSTNQVTCSQPDNFNQESSTGFDDLNKSNQIDSSVPSSLDTNNNSNS